MRLTAAFAVAMAVVLAAAGLFVYLRLKSDLDESVTAGLDARAAAVVAAGLPRPPALRVTARTASPSCCGPTAAC